MLRLLVVPLRFLYVICCWTSQFIYKLVAEGPWADVYYYAYIKAADRIKKEGTIFSLCRLKTHRYLGKLITPEVRRGGVVGSPEADRRGFTYWERQLRELFYEYWLQLGGANSGSGPALDERKDNYTRQVSRWFDDNLKCLISTAGAEVSRWYDGNPFARRPTRSSNNGHSFSQLGVVQNRGRASCA